MSEIFLSASVPVPGRGRFFETADPFLIQFAVRELVTVILGRRTLVWGGHPAITPMIFSICEDLGVSYADAVVLYQSEYFEGHMPEENREFKNLIRTPAVDGDRELSLLAMRVAMLSRPYEAAVFIGGMDGVFDEYALFKMLHPEAEVIAVSACGGASQEIAEAAGDVRDRIDFARLFYERLSVKPDERRKKSPRR